MTQIPYATKTWDWVRGCTPVTEGCRNCWAKWLADGRLKRFYPRGFGHVGVNLAKWVDAPPNWKEPQVVFVNSKSDTFHSSVDDIYISCAFTDMRCRPNHTFLVFTKRAKRMAEWSVGYGQWPDNVRPFVSISGLADLWMLDELAKVKARVRGVSFEPLLADVGDLSKWLIGEAWCPGHDGGETGGGTCPGCEQEPPPIHQVIIGAESGPNRRPCPIDAVRSIVRQCREAAGVKVWVKQLDIDGKCVHDIEQFPEDLRIREWAK